MTFSFIKLIISIEFYFFTLKIDLRSIKSKILKIKNTIKTKNTLKLKI